MAAACVSIYALLPDQQVIRHRLTAQCRDLSVTSIADQWRDPIAWRERYLGFNERAARFVGTQIDSSETLLLPPTPYLRRWFPSSDVLWATPRWVFYVAGPVRCVLLRGPRTDTATAAVVVVAGDGRPSLAIAELSDADDRAAVRHEYAGEAARP